MKKGYTLIEIIVVIAIIGLVMTSALYAFNVARIKSRDTKRLSDMKTIYNALKLYYDGNNEVYPIRSGWVNDCDGGSAFANSLQPLVDNNYINEIPEDPNNPNNPVFQCYFYSTTPNPVGCCGSSNPGFCLIFQTENTTTNYPSWSGLPNFYCVTP